MRNIFFLFIFLTCICAGSFAQRYSGSGTWEMSGAGTLSTTSMQTNSAYSVLTVAANKWEFKMKFPLLSTNASTPAMTVLTDVFNYQDKGVFSLELNLQGLNLNFQQNFTSQSLTVPCKMKFNGHEVMTTVVMNINNQGNTVLCSLDTNFLLSDMGLALGNNANIFSSNVALHLSNWVINKN